MALSNSDISNGTPDDRPRSIVRYTVPEAARALGISPEAVRNRLSRGTLESIKEKGTVYVLLAPDMVRHTADRFSDRSSDMSGGTSRHMTYQRCTGRPFSAHLRQRGDHQRAQGAVGS